MVMFMMKMMMMMMMVVVVVMMMMMNENHTEDIHTPPSLEPPTVSGFPGLGSPCIDAESGVKGSRNSQPELRPAALSRTLHFCSGEPKSPEEVGARLSPPYPLRRNVKAWEVDAAVGA